MRVFQPWVHLEATHTAHPTISDPGRIEIDRTSGVAELIRATTLARSPNLLRVALSVVSIFDCGLLGVRFPVGSAIDGTLLLVRRVVGLFVEGNLLSVLLTVVSTISCLTFFTFTMQPILILFVAIKLADSLDSPADIAPLKFDLAHYSLRAP